jgi:hypothetical protein
MRLRVERGDLHPVKRAQGKEEPAGKNIQSEAPFIRVDVLEHRLDVRPGVEAAFLFPAGEDFGDLVVPSTLAHERIPDFDLLLCRSDSVCETPLK